MADRDVALADREAFRQETARIRDGVDLMMSARRFLDGAGTIIRERTCPAAAYHPQTLVERGRYLCPSREHGPKLIEHSPEQSESWRGFSAAKPLTEIADGIVLISLPGHTRGHAAYAIDAGGRWILHVGDAFYHHGQIDGRGGAPYSLRLMERLIAHDWKRVRANHQKLSELHAQGSADLRIVNAHDPVLLQGILHSA